MSVIKETWEYYDPHKLPGFFAKHDGAQHAGTVFEVAAESDGDVARAHLAAQAPAMARMLLDLEWHGHRGWGPRCCIACEGWMPGSEYGSYGVLTEGATMGGVQVGHLDSCELVKVLRAAKCWPTGSKP